MKVRFCSLLLITVSILGGFTASNTTVGARPTTPPEINRADAGDFLLPATNTEWCKVSLSNPRSSLNVRSTNGRIVGKLKHGTSVYVDEYDGGFAHVSVKVKGRLVKQGWVASEYLACGE